jgi:hypothetical protein
VRHVKVSKSCTQIITHTDTHTDTHTHITVSKRPLGQEDFPACTAEKSLAYAF